jgi:hypothetical protein
MSEGMPEWLPDYLRRGRQVTVSAMPQTVISLALKGVPAGFKRPQLPLRNQQRSEEGSWVLSPGGVRRQVGRTKLGERRSQSLIPRPGGRTALKAFTVVTADRYPGAWPAVIADPLFA